MRALWDRVGPCGMDQGPSRQIKTQGHLTYISHTVWCEPLFAIRYPDMFSDTALNQSVRLLLVECPCHPPASSSNCRIT